MSSASWPAGTLHAIHDGVTEVRITLGRIETRLEPKPRESGPPLPWAHLGPMGGCVLLVLAALLNPALAKDILLSLLGAK